MMKTYDVKRFLDRHGKIKFWPVKERDRVQVLTYLAQKFELNNAYSEREVNLVIDAWHTFGDYAELRRGLIDHQLLFRTPNGSRYWKGEAVCSANMLDVAAGL